MELFGPPRFFINPLQKCRRKSERGEQRRNQEEGGVETKILILNLYRNYGKETFVQGSSM